MDKEKFQNLLSQLLSYKPSGLAGKDFLLTWEKSLDDLKTVIQVSEILRFFRANNLSSKIFDSGLAISIFRDKSTRTRFSFSSASNLLGLHVIDLDEKKTQVAHGETVRETMNMISFMTEVIGIRDDMFLGYGHEYMLEVANALDEGYEKQVLPQRPSIINLQCDLDHPTQSMADLQHLVNYFGGFDKLKGKKIVMSWAYSPSYAKPLSVPQGIIALMSRFGMDITLAYPQGYDLVPDIVNLAKLNTQKSGARFTITHSIEEAFKDADIVYPKSWAPYNIMLERTKFLKQGKIKALEELEKQALEENAKHKDWTTTEQLIKLTKEGKGLYMHCLPADISGVSCEHGEVDADVFEKYRIDTYKEASYKPYIIAAMILTSKFENPVQILEEIYARAKKRVII